MNSYRSIDYVTDYVDYGVFKIILYLSLCFNRSTVITLARQSKMGVLGTNTCKKNFLYCNTNDSNVFLFLVFCKLYTCPMVAFKAIPNERNNAFKCLCPNDSSQPNRYTSNAYRNAYVRPNNNLRAHTRFGVTYFTRHAARGLPNSATRVHNNRSGRFRRQCHCRFFNAVFER